MVVKLVKGVWENEAEQVGREGDKMHKRAVGWDSERCSSRDW